MWMCSGVPGNECIKIPTPQFEFNERYNCTLYGYNHSSEIIESLGKKIVNEKKIFTKFLCQSQEIV